MLTHGPLAAVGKNGVPLARNFSIAPTAKKNTKKKYAYYNKAEQRLDEPLPPKDVSAAIALDARMKKLGKNMCNQWYVHTMMFLSSPLPVTHLF